MTESQRMQADQFLRDLRDAVSVGFFDMCVKELRELGVHVEDVASQRRAAIMRNIAHYEQDIRAATTESFRELRRQEIEQLRRQLV